MFSDSRQKSFIITFAKHHVCFDRKVLSGTVGVVAQGRSTLSQVRDASRCILGHTRDTLICASWGCFERNDNSWESRSCWGLRLAIVSHERGIPSRRASPASIDYVPALCTHRPSLLPMCRPVSWPERCRVFALFASKTRKLDDVEEVKVVTKHL